MSQESLESSSGDESIDAIIADYFEAIERGEVPDRAKLIEAHPEHADELRAFFSDHAQFARAAEPLAPQQSQPPGAARAQVISLTGKPPADPDAETTDGILHDAPDPMPGEFVRYFGDYELLQEIARGGMGVVYEAKQISLNRTVALKMILAGQLAGEAEVKRFQQEAEAAANLDHPHIVPIHEVGQYKGRHYFTMKLIEGGPLSEHLPRLKGDLRASATLMMKVAKAVHFAHQRGILHRDLKPANVLLDGNDEPHVTDFGLAKRVDADAGLTITHPGGVLGTPAYMPPEQARGEKNLTTAADVYSLGAILYVLLTGQPPFRGATPLDTMRKLIDEEPASPRSLSGQVPADLETICLKCLEKDPTRRYGSADELARELSRWLNHEPIEARRVGVAGRLTRWSRRNPKLAVAYSVAASIIITLSCVYYVRLVTEKAHTTAALQGEMVARLDAESQRDQAQDALARGLYDQARAMLLSTQSGRRWKALDLLAEANRLRTREINRRVTVRSGTVTYSADVPVTDRVANLPSVVELRNETIRALLTPDARQVNRLDTSLGLPPMISDDGRYATCVWNNMNLLMIQTSQSPGGPDLSKLRGGLRVFDTVLGRQTGRFDLPTGSPFMAVTVDLDPLGRWFVGQEMDQHVLRSLNDGSIVRPLESAVQTPALDPQRSFHSFIFMADGKTLAGVEAVTAKTPGDNKEVNATGRILFWNLADGKLDPGRTIELGAIKSPMIIAAGRSGAKILARLDDRRVRVFDTAGGAPVDIPIPQSTSSGPYATVVSQGGGGMIIDPTDRFVAIQCPAGVNGKSFVVVWDLLEKKERFRGGGFEWFPLATLLMSFSPDGRQLGMGSFFGDVTIHDSMTGREIWRLHNAQEMVAALRWSPDGKHFITAGIEGGIKRWELAPPPPVRDLPATLDENDDLHLHRVSPDGRWLAISHRVNPESRLIDLNTGTLARIFDRGGYLCFSPDSRQLAVVYIGQLPLVTVFDLDTGRKLTDTSEAPPELAGPQELIEQGTMGFNEEGHFCLFHLSEGKAMVWDVTANKLLGSMPFDPRQTLFKGIPQTARYQFKTEGVGAGKSAATWVMTDLGKAGQTKRFVIQPGLVPIAAASVSEDGRWIAMSYLAGTWMGTGEGESEFRAGIQIFALDQPDAVFDLGGRDPVTGTAFSSDGKWLAVVYRRGGVVLFAVPSGQEVFRFPVSQADRAILSFERNDQWLLVSDGKAFFKVLDLERLKADLDSHDLAW
ncbi:MAG: protein kinase [Phycisphaeraceae bacterium]